MRVMGAEPYAIAQRTAALRSLLPCAAYWGARSPEGSI